MANWFNNKKHHIYTQTDKEREQKEFRIQLDLTPLVELWKKVCETHQELCKIYISNYSDFLGIMKNFYGEHNPLIDKFEVLLHKFENDCNSYYKAVKYSLDKALEEKRIELKSKQ